MQAPAAVIGRSHAAPAPSPETNETTVGNTLPLHQELLHSALLPLCRPVHSPAMVEEVRHVHLPFNAGISAALSPSHSIRIALTESRVLLRICCVEPR
ncbi:hypothetical protein AB1Y20_020683 [Prymnesium parvum]|uniref:Uncharacterized protein n=1 Tax=Prymnesium parvum TaxID=97485 RepID=A0AB34K040_PRYPA